MKPLEQLTDEELERWLTSIRLQVVIPRLTEHGVTAEVLSLCRREEELVECGVTAMHARLLIYHFNCFRKERSTVTRYTSESFSLSHGSTGPTPCSVTRYTSGPFSLSYGSTGPNHFCTCPLRCFLTSFRRPLKFAPPLLLFLISCVFSSKHRQM